MNILLIDGTKPSKCEFCGKESELRPYGPNKESLCFDCGMKDEKAAQQQFAELLKGKELIVIK